MSADTAASSAGIGSGSSGSLVTARKLSRGDSRPLTTTSLTIPGQRTGAPRFQSQGVKTVSVPWRGFWSPSGSLPVGNGIRPAGDEPVRVRHEAMRRHPVESDLDLRARGGDAVLVEDAVLLLEVGTSQDAQRPLGRRNAVMRPRVSLLDTRS
jgi:hypothetical protein